MADRSSRVLTLLMGLLLLASAVGAADEDGFPCDELILPAGTPLTEAELLEASGDGALITIAAGILIGASSGVASDIAVSYAMGKGMPSGKQLGISAGFGAATGVAGGFAAPAIARPLQMAGRSIVSGAAMLKASAVSAARWTARAAVSFGTSAHVMLHHSVRMPIQKALTSAWRWLRGV